MKQILYFFICVLCFLMGSWISDTKTNDAAKFLAESNDYKRELICAHQQYYDAAERLLDELNDRYDWVDSYDPEPYYIAVERLDTLYAMEL